PPSLSHKGERALEKLGVTPFVGHTVVDVGPTSVAISSGDGEVEHVATRTVIRAAGVAASPLAAALASAAGSEVDRAGRLTVTTGLTLPDHPEVFAIGDMVRVEDSEGTIVPLPGI